MKKNKIKLLFATAAIATLSGAGFLMANTAAQTADPALLTMKEGASIRLPSANIGNGIRFASSIDATSYDALVATDGNVVTTGTFILPKAYYTAKAIDENVESNYYWEGYAGETADKKQILNVEADVYKKEGETNYTLNGSVLDVKDANLNLEYVGVGYVKVVNGATTTYHIAEVPVDNSRTPVQVAESALDDKDVTAEDKEALGEKYVNKYIEVAGEVTATYNVKYFYESKTEAGAYVEATAEAQEGLEVAVTSYDMQAPADEAKAYGEYVLNAEKSVRNVRISRTADVELYYDYEPVAKMDFEDDKYKAYYGGEFSTEWAATGEKSWKLTSDKTWGTYAGVSVEFDIGKVNTMIATFNSSAAISSNADGIYINVLNSAGGQQSGYYNFAIDEGTKTYEFELKDFPADAVRVLNVAFVTNGETVYVDDIFFIYKEVATEPTEPTEPENPVDPNAQINFESDGITVSGYYGGESSTVWAATGSKSWLLTSDNQWAGYAGFTTSLAVQDVNTMVVTVNSSADLTHDNGLYINYLATGSATQGSQYFAFAVKEGINTYEFSVEGLPAGNVLNVAFYMSGATVYVDDISFIKK